MKVDGGCHCGKIHYEAEVNPGRVVICHCTDCQTFVGLGIPDGGAQQRRQLQAALRHTQGLRQDRRERPKARATFCADCGTPINSAVGDGDTKIVGLRVGAIRQCDQLIPSDQLGALVAAVAAAPGEHKEKGQAAELRPQGWAC